MRARVLVWASLGSLLTAAAAAEPVQYVITFNGVVVRGLIGLYDTPHMAHMTLPDDTKLGGEPDSRPADPAPGEPRRSPPTPDPSLPVIGRPTHALGYAPGEGAANPSFIEQGFLVEAFWAVRTGTPAGYFKRAHFHPADLASGFEAQHFGNPGELHGLYIRSLDGKPFRVKSVRYRVTRNRELQHKPFSIEGFSNFNINVLLARNFDPRRSVRVQFTTFPVGLPAGNDPTLPWWTLPVTGFEAVEQIYVASSASVDLDNIVLVRLQVPEEQRAAGKQ